MTDFDLSRRRMLVLGGAGAAGLMLPGPATAQARGATGGATGACVLAASPTGGAYHLDATLARGDITEGKRGVPLTLRLTVRDSTTGNRAPVPGAAVEVWHCDAWGYYSGSPGASPGGELPAAAADGGGPGPYLHGYQVADRNGKVEFATIVPGWYGTRAPHVHVRVHTGGERAGGGYEGGAAAHAGQLFFADDMIARVYQVAPYTEHTGEGPATLQEDVIYLGARSGAAGSGLLSATPVGRGRVADGYVAALTLGIDPSAGGAAA